MSFHNDSKLKKIRNNSFKSTFLEFIDILSSVERIGNYSFSKCSSIKTIKFLEDSKLKVIGDGFFSSSRLETGDGSFSECKNIISITFSGDAKLKRIGIFFSLHQLLNQFQFLHLLKELENVPLKSV